MKLYSINPATEEIIFEFNAHSNKDVMDTIEKLSQNFPKWKKTKISQRIQVLPKISTLLRQNKEEYAKIITLEMGKPITEAKAEIEKCALLCDYYYKKSEEFLRPEDRTHWTNSHKEAWIEYEPLGIVYAIMPWNFPFWQVFRCSIPAMMAGNCLLLKHSPNVSQCALTIKKIFYEAGLEGIFDGILIEKERTQEITEIILSSPEIQGVSVTGSVSTGKLVAQIAGKYLKKTVMELGGSDAFIVLDSANIENAAKTAALARCQNSGQSCIAAKRFIILDSIYNSFMEIYLEEMKLYAHSLGEPLKETTRMGPIARKDLLENLDLLVQDAIQKNAKVLLGGKKAKIPKGYFYEVTILENLNPTMKLYFEEAFGPVASIYRVPNLQKAIDLANDTPFGLGASLWTEDLNLAKKIIPEIVAGNVFVNSLVKSDPSLPFGGVKNSGHGRELSKEGLREFTNIKTIRIF
ncbi:MAG: NAD-dependent succinate-semialdehyde dehydrogenase [Leptonema sp. (in: bacteria)]